MSLWSRFGPLFRVVVLILCAAVMPNQGHSLTISDVAVVNQSSADIFEITPDYAHEFKSRIVGVSVSYVSPTVTKITAQLSWTANVIKYAPTEFAFSMADHVGASIGFTINDPSSVGYTVSYAAYTRGFLTGEMTSVGSAEEWLGEIWMKPDQLLSAIPDGPTDQIYGPWATINQEAAYANADASASAPPFLFGSQWNTPEHYGTQTFGVGVSSTFGFRSEFDPQATGETAARFGLAPTYAGFALGQYGNAPDGESGAQHGLFMEFNITALAPEPVPEELNPALAMLLALACVVRIARPRTNRLI